MSYKSLLEKLLVINRSRKVSFGVDTTSQLQKILGPEYSNKAYHSVHVSGSNGKGSVTTKIATTLHHLGYRVGLFVSPHISTWRERIQINGKFITEKQVESLLPPLLHTTEESAIPATFFELTTLLAFAYFHQQKVDFAVFETGLGGRLDSTNVITPKLSIITSISLEHTQILGNTIEQIAIEKCGIIKPGVPVLVGPNVPRDISSKIAYERNSPYYEVSHKFDDFDDENTEVSRRAILLLGGKETGSLIHLPPGDSGLEKDSKLRQSLSIRPPLRSEHHKIKGVDVILDVGHNPDALFRLQLRLSHLFPSRPLRVVVGFSKDKDIKSALTSLSSLSNHIHITYARSDRAASIDDIKQIINSDKNLSNAHKRGVHFNIHGDGDVKSTIQQALQMSIQSNQSKLKSSGSSSDGGVGSESSQNEVLVVCGTFFIMSDARAALGIPQEVDPFDLNERFDSRARDSHASKPGV